MKPSRYSPPSSARIGTRQNDPRALRLLIAQRRLYTRAKRWQSVRWSGLLVLGIGAPFVSLITPRFAIVAGALAGVWLFVGRTLLTWLEARSMVKAACVQEEFDHYLFDMPQSITRNERPTPEDVDLLLHGNDVERTAQREKLTNWYPIDTASTGIVTIAIAQRANASYTARLIRTTVSVWATVTVVWLMLLILWGSVSGITLSDFLLGALFPVLPAVLDVAEYVLSTWKAARDRADLAMTIEGRLARPDLSIDGQDLLVWQERLFDLRRTTPQVPDWLYKATRTRNEHAMTAAARQLRNGS